MKRSVATKPEAIRLAKSWRGSLHTRILLASVLVFGLMTGAVVSRPVLEVVLPELVTGVEVAICPSVCTRK